ncbi:MAG TPA: tetratricopeptide repeat protein [Candidatus Omnitrophota bacterium]|nr:tetratricopeptide repeat protein [Candidatus Omnitrophota bacterium]HPD84057.1 tetratricopeptide repeat protein [Candidatus Omnitrophota bacterium]HRZ02914.1 tetratricopeptide repeat protein [Candidatus Omnitrophota bacterium]
MSDLFWKKVSYVFGLLALAVLFGLLVFSANIEIKDLDLWLHLKMGEFISQNHYVPESDVLSCSIAGKPWINHEWLFQVIVYQIYHAFGPDGLINMQVGVVVATFLLLLFLGYNRDRQFGVIFLLLLILMVYRTRFTIRPDIFSLLFFALYIHVLALHLDKKWSVFALFFIQVLWTNFHGFFFFGPFLVLVGIGSEFLKRRVRLPWQWNTAGRLSDGEYVRLKWIFLIVVLASLINPATFKGAWYPINVLIHIPGESRIFFNNIQELRQPLQWSNVFSAEPFPHYKLLILLSAFSFMLNFRKIDIGDLLIWAIFLFVSLVAVRNLVFFSFVAYLVCLTNLMSRSLNSILPLRFNNQKFLYISVASLKLILAFWMIQYGTMISRGAYFDFDKYELKSEFGGISQRNFPNKAVDFLVDNHVKGNFFNDFNSGAYLIGRCFPDIKVFIDGRTEVYGPEFFKSYQKIWGQGDTASLKKAIEDHHITGALLNSVHEPLLAKLLNNFYKDKDWILVYLNYDGVIFLKNVPANKTLIDKFRIDLTKWKVKEIDLQRLASRSVAPYQYVNRAHTLDALGFQEAALREAKHALKIAPDYMDAYKISGKIYGQQKEFRKAFENFRIASMLAPGDTETRANLGLAYEKLGDPEGALRQYRQLITDDPKSPKGYFTSAKTCAGLKRYEEMMGFLKKAHRLAPKDSKDLLEIGDIVYENKNFGIAKEVYAMAIETEKNLEKVHNKIGLCYLSVGNYAKAKAEFIEGLKFSPRDEELKKSLKELDRKTRRK